MFKIFWSLSEAKIISSFQHLVRIEEVLEFQDNTESMLLQEYANLSFDLQNNLHCFADTYDKKDPYSNILVIKSTK